MGLLDFLRIVISINGLRPLFAQVVYALAVEVELHLSQHLKDPTGRMQRMALPIGCIDFVNM